MSTRFTRSIALAGFLAASVAPSAAAQPTCWDFATLDQTHLYHLGEIFLAPTATIEMKHYLLNGTRNSNPAGVAHAQQTQISGGPAPEFRLYLLNAHVVPNNPAGTVSFQFGHIPNGVSGVAHGNLGVNGELIETTSGMAALNGRVLGDPAVGSVMVTVNMTTPPGASPERGTVQLQAVNGAIGKFTLGGIQLFVKNVCFQ